MKLPEITKNTTIEEINKIIRSLYLEAEATDKSKIPSYELDHAKSWLEPTSYHEDGYLPIAKIVVKYPKNSQPGLPEIKITGDYNEIKKRYYGEQNEYTIKFRFSTKESDIKNCEGILYAAPKKNDR